ncbi:hypothetical protein TNIN_67371 [Trichonephila inaurata madagascariensis]|uniref:Uncharacterized protein n=1 Tax=Trichonephila inaurata madagascariensis TaxID=2747483 RepID=A0A8X7CRF3_9ARAC|nr:hypothetical protein TNIN_67371 [Trichonephila inaurata madagascariensis]
MLRDADHPIPFRHSLSRSTINTSKKVVIDCAEGVKDEYHPYTTSSILNKDKSECYPGLCKCNLMKSDSSVKDECNSNSDMDIQRLSVKKEDIPSFKKVQASFLNFGYSLLGEITRGIIKYKEQSRRI